MKKYNERQMKTITEYFYQKISHYNGQDQILFKKIDSQLLKEILFTFIEEEGVYVYRFKSSWNDQYKKIDFSNISFNGVDIRNIDFTGFKNVKLDPQDIYDKNFFGAKLCGVEIVGSLDGAKVRYTDFTGSKGAKINPQNICDKTLFGTKLCDVEIIGSLDGVDVSYTDFTGSRGAKINPQNICDKTLFGTKLCDVEIIGSLDGVKCRHTNFKGSINRCEEYDSNDSNLLKIMAKIKKYFPSSD